jgi:hypothetical protein
MMLRGTLVPGSIQVRGLTLESNNLHSVVVKLDAAVLYSKRLTFGKYTHVC